MRPRRERLLSVYEYRYSVTRFSRGINSVITQQRGAWQVHGSQGCMHMHFQHRMHMHMHRPTCAAGAAHTPRPAPRNHGMSACSHRWWRSGWPRPSRRCGTPVGGRGGGRGGGSTSEPMQANSSSQAAGRAPQPRSKQPRPIRAQRLDGPTIRPAPAATHQPGLALQQHPPITQHSTTTPPSHPPTHLLVHLRAVVEAHGTRAGHGPAHAGRVPRADAGHLAQTAMGLAGQAGHAPAGHHALSALRVGTGGRQHSWVSALWQGTRARMRVPGGRPEHLQPASPLRPPARLAHAASATSPAQP